MLCESKKESEKLQTLKKKKEKHILLFFYTWNYNQPTVQFFSVSHSDPEESLLHLKYEIHHLLLAAVQQADVLYLYLCFHLDARGVPGNFVVPVAREYEKRLMLQ